MISPREGLSGETNKRRFVTGEEAVMEKMAAERGFAVIFSSYSGAKEKDEEESWQCYNGEKVSR